MTTTCSLRQKGPLTKSHTFFTHIRRAVSKKALIARNHKPWGGKNTWQCDALHLNSDLCFNLLKTKYRPWCSEMLSGLCSAFGTCWVVQCHPSIDSNPRISTTEHVHALCFLSHIGCTVTINRVKKVPQKMSLHWLKAILW